MDSTCRYNYHPECEAAVNRQINLKLTNSYVYLSVAYFFDRHDQALPGFSQFFKKLSDKYRDYAFSVMKMQNQRGGRLVLKPIAMPDKNDWENGLVAMNHAFALETAMNQSTLDLHIIAQRCNDHHLCEFIESNFFDQQLTLLKELKDHISLLSLVGTGLSEYLYYKEMCSRC